MFSARDLQALELPYEQRDLSMLIFLPAKVGGLAEFERRLTAANLKVWQGKLRDNMVDVTLPRFKVTAEFSLKEPLTALGMGVAFSDKADFAGMTSSEGLQISAVLHKAFIDVNEEGTEAAGATVVEIEKKSKKGGSVRLPPEFRADQPFVFFIRDERNGSILFLGRVVDTRN